ncbi:hypothetical protein PSACC_03711, partial [Paramicrosporidium saccamoebae]
IPVRRLLHDDTLAGAILEKGTSASTLWGGGSVWTIGAIVGAALALVAMLVGLSFVVIPFQTLRNWQKRRIGGAAQTRRFQFCWLVLLGVAVAVTADAVWSNVTAFGLYGGAEQTLRMIDTVHSHAGVLTKAALATERFVTGIQGSVISAATGGKDLQPALKLVEEYATDVDSFANFLKYNVSFLTERLSDSQLPSDKLQTMQQMLKDVGDSEALGKLAKLSEAMKNMRGETLNGLGNLASFWPDLEPTRLHIVELGERLQSTEMVRFLWVFFVLFLFVGIVAAGLQFFRMKRFRIVMCCMTAVALMLSLMYLGHAFHLVSGTLLGAFCDALTGDGTQKPLLLPVSDTFSLDLAKVNHMASSCSAGHDMMSALLSAYATDDKQLQNINPLVTLDPRAQEVIIKTPLATVNFAVKDRQVDYKAALDKAVDGFVSTTADQVGKLNATSVKKMVEGAQLLSELDYSGLTDTLQMLSLLLATADSVSSPVDLMLKNFKVTARSHIDRIKALLAALKTQSATIYPAAKALSLHLDNAQQNPTEFLAGLQRTLKADVAQFVADTLQPAMNCQKTGAVVEGAFGTVCSAAGALQALFLAFGILINMAIAFCIMLLICRKFSDIHTEAE